MYETVFDWEEIKKKKESLSMKKFVDPKKILQN